MNTRQNEKNNQEKENNQVEEIYDKESNSEEEYENSQEEQQNVQENESFDKMKKLLSNSEMLDQNFLTGTLLSMFLTGIRVHINIEVMSKIGYTLLTIRFRL